MFRTLATTIVCVVLAAPFAVAPPASAYLYDVSVAPGTVTSTTSLAKSAVAQCPSGSVALGGEASLFPAPLDAGLGSFGLQSRSSFAARAVETDPLDASWSLSATALCAVSSPSSPPAPLRAARHVKAVEIVRRASGYASSGFRSVTVPCPPGKRVISGGANINDIRADVAMASLRRSADGASWEVTAHEVDSTDREWQLSAIAVCANVSTETATSNYVGRDVIVVGSSAPATRDPYKVHTANCPDGTGIVGGGAVLPGAGGGSVPADVVITASMPGGTGPGSTRWVATAGDSDPTASDVPSPAWSLTAQAICAPLNASRAEQGAVSEPAPPSHHGHRGVTGDH